MRKSAHIGSQSENQAGFMVVAVNESLYGAEEQECAIFKTLEEAAAQARMMDEDEVAVAEGWRYYVRALS